MPSLIHQDQSGLMKGRQVFDATRRLIDIIQNTRTSSLLLSLDVEKAFNRVHWSYLQATLCKFGFQGCILSAIMALYATPSAQVYTSEMLSKPFQISNGTRQGCPLSPLIFNLLMEPLAEHIRSNASISGFRIRSMEHKIYLFTDVIMMITNTLSSLALIQHVLQRFSYISYYNVNENKSYILDLGLIPQVATYYATSIHTHGQEQESHT